MAARVECRIDLSRLAENFAFLRKCAGDCSLMPVMKYDGYGLGALRIAEKLKSCGAVRFAVANVDEAVEVKKVGLDVQILGLLPDYEIPDAVAADIICPVTEFSTAQEISREACRQGKVVRIAVKLDTGMSRLGFAPESCCEEVVKIFSLPNLEADSLFSHFSTAAKPDLEYAAFQIKRFKSAYEKLRSAGLDFPWVHHAAGDAIVKIPEATRPPFNLARPGGSMYGEDFDSGCRQIISLVTKVGVVRELSKGSCVGYYRTFTAPENMRVAVLTAGYADGIPLALSNRGYVLIRGRKCPIIGRVAMDYTIVDVSAVPDIAAGDEATLLGRDGGESVTVRQWGEWKSTHGHDIWCAIGHRTARVYLD